MHGDRRRRDRRVGRGDFDNPGPDLLALLCGSEGMLGIVTGATVLLPAPETKTVAVAFSQVVDASNAVAIIAAGIIPPAWR